MPALLTCEDLRVDVDEVPACDGLSLTTTGERVLVLGVPRAVFEAACGLRVPSRGTMTIQGVSPREGVAARRIAGAPLDPPFPPKWTPLEYATWSARLSGHDASEAKKRAQQALDALSMGSLAKTAIARIASHARRATVVAAAMATGASVLVLEDPLAGLPEETWRAWGRALVTALEDRSWIVFAPRVPLTSPLAFHSDEAVVVTGVRVDAQGPPAEVAAAERRYVARLQGSLTALSARLASRGAKVSPHGSSSSAHVVFDLGATLTTAELLGLCQESDVTVVELLPVARALA